MKLSDYRAFSAALNAEIKTALAKHGLVESGINAAINEETGEVTLKVKARDANATTTPEAVHWNREAEVYGLNPAWLGETVKFGQGEAKIVGLLNTRSLNRVALDMDGKRMVCTPAALIRVAKAAGLAPCPDFHPL
jgi:hypothetical protein